MKLVVLYSALKQEGMGGEYSIIHFFFQISTHKTTFTRFLWCLSFSLILTMGEMYKPFKNVAISTYLILLEIMQAKVSLLG